MAVTTAEKIQLEKRGGVAVTPIHNSSPKGQWYKPDPDCPGHAESLLEKDVAAAEVCLRATDAEPSQTWPGHWLALSSNLPSDTYHQERWGGRGWNLGGAPVLTPDTHLTPEATARADMKTPEQKADSLKKLIESTHSRQPATKKS